MKGTKIKLPWILIGSLVGKLIVSPKGGITPEEAEDLLEALGNIISRITLQMED